MIVEKFYINVHDRDHEVRCYYDRPVMLGLAKPMLRDSCLSKCRNKVIKDSPYEINIVNGFLYANFDGPIYMQYRSLPFDGESNIIIPDTPQGLVLDYVDNFVKMRFFEDATYQAGAREVSIIEEPIAAAIGAGIDIARPCGNMIVDIGGGTADIAVISLGGSVVSTSVKIAGDDFDEAIVRYMRKKHNLLIGERTAEDIKIKIGTCFPLAQNETMDVRGRNLVTGLPKTVTVSSEETEEALREPTLQIVEAVHSVLEKTPPELAADVADRGIVLTGGGALLRGLEELIEDRTGINTMTADDPMTCVAIGTGKYVEFLSGKRDDD